MTGLLLLAAVAPVLAQVAPSPSPTLPEIGRVRANVLCTALRQNIAPTVVGLMKNDELIGAGHRAFMKMSRDQVDRSETAIDMDMLYLQQIQTRLVKNLGIIDRLLDDSKRFAANPTSADERDAVRVRDHLRTVADAQRKTLDLVSGTIDTHALGEMQNEFPDQMRAAVGQPDASPSPTPAGGFIGAAGLPDYTPQQGLPTFRSEQTDTVGHSIYDRLTIALEGHQATIAQHEKVATTAVVQAVAQCRGTGSPSPGPALAPAPGSFPTLAPQAFPSIAPTSYPTLPPQAFPTLPGHR